MMKIKLTFETKNELNSFLDDVGRHRLKTLKVEKPRGRYRKAYIELYTKKELRIHEALGVACPAETGV